MIGLKDFVKETLVQVAVGVEEAQKTLADACADVQINPPASSELSQPTAELYPISHRRLAHLIELDIAVVASEGGVVVLPAITADQLATGAVSRLRFKVGVSFPMAEAPEQKETVPSSFELEV